MRLLSRLLSTLLVCACASLAAEETAPAPTDVRVLIDISGSMVQTDPQNQRTPAINMLIDSLADGSEAGIWTFGRYVNLLVEHDTVNDAWRAQARAAVASLEPVAQRTNLGAVLDQASYDFGYSNYQAPTDVVLITDGRVDIAPNAQVNQVERDRILDTVLPRYAQAGARIHSLALTDAADAGLLEQMANQSGGVFARVASADDIQAFILEVLQAVDAGNEIPLENAGFEVDSQISEVTALVLHDRGEMGLVSPSGETSTALAPKLGQQWRVGPGYTLVTVRQPQTGRWHISGQISEGSRVSVVSDMNLRWRQPGGSVTLIGQPIQMELEAIDQNGQPVPVELTEVMTPTVTVNDDVRSGVRWRDGVLSGNLPNVYDAGPLTVAVRVDGGTFQRLLRRTFQNRPPFMSEVLVMDGDYQWRLYPAHPDLVPGSEDLRAHIVSPDGWERDVVFEQHDSGYYSMVLDGDQEPGEYQLSVRGDLRFDGREVHDLGIDPVTLSLPIAATQPRIWDPQAEAAAARARAEAEAAQQAMMQDGEHGTAADDAMSDESMADDMAETMTDDMDEVASEDMASDDEMAADMADPEPKLPYVKEPMPRFAELTEEMSVPASQQPMMQPNASPAQSDDAISLDQTMEEGEGESSSASGPGRDIPWLRFMLYAAPGLLVLVAFFAFFRRLEYRGKLRGNDKELKEDPAPDIRNTDVDELDLGAGFGADDVPELADWDGEAPLVSDQVDPELELETDEFDLSELEDFEEPEEAAPEPKQEYLGELDEGRAEDGVMPTNSGGDDEDDLFDISNMEEDMSELEGLSLDDDDPFAEDSNEDDAQASR
ncbi:VWA domain-containing protein [Saccharospirillum mangrovi]|uniref:VWA domain-containing protein n=1 Tax=Saccharospirillum mangrovi TaxID=2161747 RepID=UPI000D342CD5|nr:vWA domain-containing protein [Saccharospirillum mangrovi]